MKFLLAVVMLAIVVVWIPFAIWVEIPFFEKNMIEKNANEILLIPFAV